MKWNPYKLPSPLELAVTELEQAQRDKLRAEAQREYFQQLCTMLDKRIPRLKTAIETLTNAETSSE